MRLLSFSYSLGILGGLAACALGSTAEEPAPKVRVENQASRDVDVYVWNDDQRGTRLGFVPAGDTAVFVLPEAVTAGAEVLHFEARPLRGNDGTAAGEPFTSEPFPPPKEVTITWTIPPAAPAYPTP